MKIRPVLWLARFLRAIPIVLILAGIGYCTKQAIVTGWEASAGNNPPHSGFFLLLGVLVLIGLVIWAVGYTDEHGGGSDD